MDHAEIEIVALADQYIHQGRWDDLASLFKKYRQHPVPEELVFLIQQRAETLSTQSDIRPYRKLLETATGVSALDDAFKPEQIAHIFATSANWHYELYSLFIETKKKPVLWAAIQPEHINKMAAEPEQIRKILDTLRDDWRLNQTSFSVLATTYRLAYFDGGTMGHGYSLLLVAPRKKNGEFAAAKVEIGCHSDKKPSDMLKHWADYQESAIFKDHRRTVAAPLLLAAMREIAGTSKRLAKQLRRLNARAKKLGIAPHPTARPLIIG